MSGARPYFQHSIAQLEQLVEQHRSDRQTLEIISAELQPCGDSGGLLRFAIEQTQIWIRSVEHRNRATTALLDAILIGDFEGE
ncbi:MAG: hypothetical protein HC788_02385 [Sphingopyxis sp.]|nr:hypothetical protein [Sphingopyxis sp.]